MEFKAGEHKGLQEVAKRLNDYTKHVWNKDDEAFNLIAYAISEDIEILCLMFFGFKNILYFRFCTLWFMSK
jgi:tetrahydromethanopterin S-methyltransferase subunit G